MSWFEQQIKQRKTEDDERLRDSLENIASSIIGQKRTKNIAEVNQDAINAVLASMGFHSETRTPLGMNALHDQLSYLCSPFGVMYRKVKLEGEWWKDSIGPILGIRKSDGGAQAFMPKGFGYYFIRDGRKEKVRKSIVDEYECEGYCFYKPYPNRKLNLFDLVKYALMTRSIRDILLILLFMAISTAIGLLVPQASNFLYGSVVESGSFSLLFSTIFFFICAAISALLFGKFQGLYNEIIEAKMDIALQAATMMRVLSLPPSFFRKYSSGELATRSGYLTSLTKTLMGLIFGTGMTALFSLAYVSSIIEFAPALAGPSIIVILASIVFSLIVTFARQKLTKESMEIQTKESGMTYAMVAGMKKIKSAGAEKRAFSRWANLYAEQSRRKYNPPAYLKLSGVISMAISTVGTLMMYSYAIDSGVSMAEYNAFMAAFGMVQGAFSSLASIITSSVAIKPVLEMAKPMMECQPEFSEHKKMITELKGKIEFNNVSFSYEENSPLIVNDMSFTILPNQYIGIVGKTGCGKSTLVRLLLGFEKPCKGSIYYDGRDLASIDMKSLRQRIGVVMQDSQLFQGDIYSNITISAPQLTLDEAWEAAEIAGIADDIAEMPMGMQTVISEGAGGISGGQKQRLVIARAIAPKPKILIFDEATSALDNITQKKISEALDHLNCTRIVIAHRLSTIKRCDRILFLDGGKIVEDGTYEELIAKNGQFAELVERQRLDV